jgi:ribosomal protein S18 acetylase RimI-like enzyme
MFDIHESYMTESTEQAQTLPSSNKSPPCETCKHFWVAVNNDNKVLGCVGMIMSTYNSDDDVIYPNKEVHPHNVCELVRMSVSEEARGKGLGSRLCSVFEAHAREKGMTRICLSTLEEMNLAVGLYRKCGYRLLMKSIVDKEFFRHVAEEENFEPEEVVVVHYGKDLLK